MIYLYTWGLCSFWFALFLKTSGNFVTTIKIIHISNSLVWSNLIGVDVLHVEWWVFINELAWFNDLMFFKCFPAKLIRWINYTISLGLPVRVQIKIHNSGLSIKIDRIWLSLRIDFIYFRIIAQILITYNWSHRVMFRTYTAINWW